CTRAPITMAARLDDW
nr:immunoglobulin heavy chain junction region [Macaca mulatta]MOV41574.1 immunoglobulin heavy chain junction region [Macaca mulatta]